jgi:peptide/nickel transport system permease protein
MESLLQTAGPDHQAALPSPGEDAAFEADSRLMVAGQWQLIWWKFRKHRMAVLSGIFMLLVIVAAVFADFVAPVSTETYTARYSYAPPQQIKFAADLEGGFGAYVNGYRAEVNPVTTRRSLLLDETVRIPVGLFVRGEPYVLFGLFPADIHLIAPLEPGRPMYLLGADRLGRDVLSRTVHATRVSISIGLVGVGISLFLGVLIGGLSGYYGGAVDTVVQRTIEFLQAIPAIPLWMGLAAAIPQSWPPLMVYFMITVILSVLGWTGLARVVRGRFLSLRTEDFVVAARLDGASDMRIIMRHMVPSFMSHIIAVVTLAVPAMILAETALSFLGVGLRAPVVSWGVLLQEAQNIRSIAAAPWLFWPGFAVVSTVLALNFLGDGLRDAADPYAD